jgi:predicted site-specific integrase-resolvase
MWKAKTLPVPAYQLPTGTVVIEAQRKIDGVALYSRVCSADQKGDLDRQLARLTEYAVANKMMIVDAVKEVGSGLNGRRKGMMRLLGNSQVQTILVEHRDRLMRFGFEYVEATLAAQGRKVVVIEAEELNDDMVRDLHEVIVSMCARLYGKRSAKNRAQKALDAIHNHE